ncbi:MAG: sigma-70 region 4 domain-containing protein [Acetobacteraceae bacterium]|nr:sigma-70 region 4 domain-containing protein [Acetobacteraceae bacterium]
MEIRGVERLSFRERQVVALKELGMGNEAVARRLGLAPATVATLYHRARVKGYQVVLVQEGDPLGLFGTEEEGGDLSDERESGRREDRGEDREERQGRVRGPKGDEGG